MAQLEAFLTDRCAGFVRGSVPEGYRWPQVARRERAGFSGAYRSPSVKLVPGMVPDLDVSRPTSPDIGSSRYLGLMYT